MPDKEKDKETTYEVTVAKPGRHNRKYEATATIKTSESKKTKESQKNAEEHLWNQATKVKSYQEPFTPIWEVGYLNGELEPFARILLNGNKAIIVPDKENYFDIGILQGLRFRIGIAPIANYDNIPIYTCVIERTDVKVKRRGRPRKQMRKVIIPEEKKRQIRMTPTGEYPQTEEEFYVDTDKLVFWDDGKMTEIIKALLKEITGIQWYTGLLKNTLVLPGGASTPQLKKAEQVLLSNDLFI